MNNFIKSMMISIIFIFGASMSAYGASYDVKEIEYNTNVAETVLVHGKSLNKTTGQVSIYADGDGVRNTLVFRCDMKKNQTVLLHNLKGFAGSPIAQATGFTIQFYPKGDTAMHEFGYENTIFVSGVPGQTLRDAFEMLNALNIDGHVVFHLFDNDGISEHSPSAWSLAYPVEIGKKIIAELNNISALSMCSTDNLNTQVYPL